MSFEGFSKLAAFVFDLQLFSNSVTISREDTVYFCGLTWKADFYDISHSVILEEDNGVFTLRSEKENMGAKVIVSGDKLSEYGIDWMSLSFDNSVSLDSTGTPKLTNPNRRYNRGGKFFRRWVHHCR